MRTHSLSAIGLLAALCAWSTPLPPGAAVNSLASNDVGTPLTASTTTPYTLPLGGAGNLSQAVRQVSASTFDFYYQWRRQSGLPIVTLVLAGFRGFAVEAFQSTDSAPAPFVADGRRPFAVGRSVDGDVIVAAYSPFGSPGNSSILILRVSGAGGYTLLTPPASGFLNLASISSQYAPTPEPSFYAAVALGLAGLFLVRHRRRPVPVRESSRAS